MSRRQARELSLQILYLNTFRELNKDELQKSIFYFAEYNDLTLKSSIEFALKIIEGTLANLNVIDNYIKDILKNWSLDRLSKVDLNIIRIAIYEILWCSDIPNKVSVNEANELAKKYSNKDSNKFVNGLLDCVIKKGGSIVANYNA